MSTAMTAPVAPVTNTGTPPAAAAPSRRGRSVLAVTVGLVAIFAVTTAVDLVGHALGIYAAPGQPYTDASFVLAAAYRVLFGIGGCYLTACLAPNRRLGHALVLGGIGTVLALLGSIAMWGAGPAWYALVVIAMALPCAWAGGALALRRR